ncbi:hypothetical protein [Geothrix sp. PMB-07]|uniref:hypothetical protein n=1 Tax=Geothrix sp. PMB-07 TaxID=3068640 RepID=UPI0027408431|nr:hypothetical protein [Geothrix sp. PMB-07]WLT31507.1 hypothetical protein Q9293_17490 [Geothrix sp. PMB-07]
MLLGTAVWAEGPIERRALVARLASGRLADLNRIEAVRLRKLGEGDPERMAEALVPASLRRVLEGGPRALARARQAAAYAEKWERRGTLPATLAPPPELVQLLPCLPRPLRLRRSDGQGLDRLGLRGPGAELSAPPQPCLAVLGLAGGTFGGFCLALEDGGSAVLGAWMSDEWPTGSLELKAGAVRRSVPLRAWEGLELPPLHAGEVLLLPPPRLKALPELAAGAELLLTVGFEQMTLRLGPEGVHPTVQ